MFRRSEERNELRFHVEQGRSILMLAPRRIGKTWLIDRLAEDLRVVG
jgi:AAA+ ATPase superfamily predicted ATPase